MDNYIQSSIARLIAPIRFDLPPVPGLHNDRTMKYSIMDPYNPDIPLQGVISNSKKEHLPMIVSGERRNVFN
jgi:hypothetical protein